LPEPNVHQATVKGFGVEWSRFDQTDAPPDDLTRYFEGYFRIFPWDRLSAGAVGMDVGCGSGRWARFVSQRVGRLHCVDASAEALAVARRNLASQPNCQFHHASLENVDLPDGSLDFAYSLGVLHHVPDTAAAMKACVSKLKPGAPFLLYLYYAFDNRPAWFRALWRTSDLGRQVICRLPDKVKLRLTDLIAAIVYLPMARLSALAEKLGFPVELMPLAHYRRASLYTMRTDALDRFGTRLEQRFTAGQIREMMTGAGLERICFADAVPYWCAVGYKR
jgi:SAM-dependent methyltransferase